MEEHGGCDNYDVLKRHQSQSDQHLTTTGRGVVMGVTSGGGYRTLEVEGSEINDPICTCCRLLLSQLWLVNSIDQSIAVYSVC